MTKNHLIPLFWWYRNNLTSSHFKFQNDLCIYYNLSQILGLGQWLVISIIPNYWTILFEILLIWNVVNWTWIFNRKCDTLDLQTSDAKILAKINIYGFIIFNFKNFYSSFV